MTARSAAFWTRDRLRGGPILTELETVRNQSSSFDMSRLRSAVTDQLNHATSRVPFYSNLRGCTDLSAFPVVDKAVINANYDLSVARDVAVNKMHVASTSGSTGTPFRVYHDPQKRRRVLADTLHWGGLAGYELGLPLLHLKVWSDRNRMSKFSQLTRNVVPIDTTKLTGEQLLRIIRKYGSEKRVSIISYSSTLTMLSRYLERASQDGRVSGEQSDIRIASIIGQSEALPPQTRATLLKHLQVLPIARYGLEELGIVAQQTMSSGESYRVNWPSQYVEILDTDADVPVEPGQLGRIVVTELHNRVQPLIRYDTGDLGAFALNANGTADYTSLKRVEGRRADQVYDVNDAPLTSMVMYNLWWKFPEIAQYQLVQRAKADYLLRINPGTAEVDTLNLIREFKAIVGSNASVAVELTSDEFVLSSGKRKVVVSHYRPGCAQD